VFSERKMVLMEAGARAKCPWRVQPSSNLLPGTVTCKDKFDGAWQHAQKVALRYRAGKLMC
jgi:hypothetical protein